MNVVQPCLVQARWNTRCRPTPSCGGGPGRSRRRHWAQFEEREHDDRALACLAAALADGAEQQPRRSPRPRDPTRRSASGRGVEQGCRRQTLAGDGGAPGLILIFRVNGPVPHRKDSTRVHRRWVAVGSYSAGRDGVGEQTTGAGVVEDFDRRARCLDIGDDRVDLFLMTERIAEGVVDLRWDTWRPCRHTDHAQGKSSVKSDHPRRAVDHRHRWTPSSLTRRASTAPPRCERAEAGSSVAPCAPEPRRRRSVSRCRPTCRRRRPESCRRWPTRDGGAG